MGQQVLAQVEQQLVVVLVVVVQEGASAHC